MTEATPLPPEVGRLDSSAVDAEFRLRVAGLGRLGELACWLAAAQGASPPREPGRPRLVVVAGDHPGGVSSQPPGSVEAAVAGLRSGAGPVADLAGRFGVGVRLADTDAAGAEQALAAGRALADAEVDGGADLILAAHLGYGASSVAAVLVAALTGSEPVAVVGQRRGLEDAAWMRKTALVRDALRQVRAVNAQWEPLRLLAMAGGPDLAMLTGLLVGAAARRTPVLLDGLVPMASALVAGRVAPPAIQWWRWAGRSGDPAETLAGERLGLHPVLDLGLAGAAADAGAGGVLALLLVRAAALLAAGPATG